MRSADAYAVYYITGDMLLVPEIMGADILPLMNTLAAMADNRKLSIKVPIGTAAPGFDSTFGICGAMALINAPALMKELCGAAHIAAEVFDPVIPQNNGIFAFDGSPAKEGHIRLSAGHLMQLLCGYRDISALLQGGCGELIAPRALQLYDLLPPLDCFCVDEY